MRYLPPRTEISTVQPIQKISHETVARVSRSRVPIGGFHPNMVLPGIRLVRCTFPPSSSVRTRLATSAATSLLPFPPVPAVLSGVPGVDPDLLPIEPERESEQKEADSPFDRVDRSVARHRAACSATTRASACASSRLRRRGADERLGGAEARSTDPMLRRELERYEEREKRRLFEANQNQGAPARRSSVEVHFFHDCECGHCGYPLKEVGAAIFMYKDMALCSELCRWKMLSKDAVQQLAGRESKHTAAGTAIRSNKLREPRQLNVKSLVVPYNPAPPLHSTPISPTDMRYCPITQSLVGIHY